MNNFFRIFLLLAMLPYSQAFTQSLPKYKNSCSGGKFTDNLWKTQNVQREGLDLGIILGTAHALTDMGGAGIKIRGLIFDVQPRATGPQFGAYLRYHFSDMVALNLTMNYAQIGAADSLSHENSGRFTRGYHFRNTLFELSLQTEVYVPKNWIYIRPDIYVFSGFLLLFHEPRLQNALGPIDIAAVRSPQPVIPLGMGIHYTTTNNLRLGFQMGLRITYFDTLDGYEPLQGPNNDSYFFNSFSIGYVFGTRRTR